MGGVGFGVLAGEAEGVDPQAAKTTANSTAAKATSKPRKCLCSIVIPSLARRTGRRGRWADNNRYNNTNSDHDPNNGEYKSRNRHSFAFDTTKRNIKTTTYEERGDRCF